MRINTFYSTIIVFILSAFLIGYMIVNALFGETDGTGGVFCEAARHGHLILQPVNSWSNIGFVLAGLTASWQLTYGQSPKNNLFYKSSFFAKFICGLMVLLGPASMAMHATETSLGGLFDMNSMYMIAGFMCGYALVRYYKLPIHFFFIIFFICLIIGNASPQLHKIINIDFFLGNLAFGTMCFVGLLHEFLYHKKYKGTAKIKFAVYCAITFVVAFIIWNFGRNGSCLCFPESPFQLHAVWHLLCALSVYFLFRYYISENNTN